MTQTTHITQTATDEDGFPVGTHVSNADRKARREAALKVSTKTRKILGYATQGAVKQHGGSLPIYECDGCGMQIVFPSSKRTGRIYPCNISRGYHDQRFYIGSDLHRCTDVQAAVAAIRLQDRRRAYTSKITTRGTQEIQEAEAAALADGRDLKTDPEVHEVIDRVFTEWREIAAMTDAEFIEFADTNPERI